MARTNSINLPYPQKLSLRYGENMSSSWAISSFNNDAKYFLFHGG